MIDAVGPERPTFNELVGCIREAVGSRSLVVHVPYVLVPLLSSLLGLLLRDVLLTKDELHAMAEGLADTDGPATGTTRISDWIAERGTDLGIHYANELQPPLQMSGLLEAGQHLGPTFGLHRVGRVEVEPVDHAAEPLEHLAGDVVERAHHGEGVEHLVVDQVGHLVPGAALGQRVELGLEVAPAVQLEHRSVGRGRAVEGELGLDRLGGRLANPASSAPVTTIPG